tara:strand:+ start:66 stop:848 length:783 start_codon:yes stop_codon:yes gene_type:complete
MNYTYNNNNYKSTRSVIVAVNQPPPPISEIIPNRTIYTTVEVAEFIPKNYSRQKVIPQRNPIRHYRRQYSTVRSSKNVDINTINRPGKTIVRANNDCPECNEKNTVFIHQEIESNNLNTLCCNNKHKQIRSLRTNIPNKTLSISNLRERRARDNTGKAIRGQTIDHNYCCDKQVIIKNGGECNNQYINNNNEYITNKHPSTNGTTSITQYKQEYLKKYTENTNILNNSRCCNNIKIKDPNYFICRPNSFPNTRRGRTICI